MPRSQFTLKSLLWLMVVVAAFFGGSSWKHRLLGQRIAELETEKQLVGTMLSLYEFDRRDEEIGFTPEHRFFMDEESWSLVQHAAEKARLDTSVWIKRRLAKAAGRELRRRTPPKD